VLEVEPTLIGVIGCYGRPQALDSLSVATVQLRIAPDELLLVCAPDERASALELASGRLVGTDAGAVAFDVSGAHAAFTLRGDDRLELFARLCAILPQAPPAQLLGLFAHVPAKLVLGEDELLVIVSAALSHHVRERIEEAGHDLGVAVEVEAPFAWSPKGEHV
jgi:hypothetical protein